jgi:hypothetical protein
MSERMDPETIRQAVGAARGVGDPTLGTDAEFFYTDNVGKVVPSDNVLPSEAKALDTWDGKADRAVFVDGIQGEFRTRASTCRAFVLDDMVSGLQTAYKVATKHDLRMLFKGCVLVDKSVLDAVQDPRSLEFGCMPHRSAWAGGEIEAIRVDGHVHPERYAGVHVHLGHRRLTDPPTRLKMVLLGDLIAANTFVLFEDSQSDKSRRASGYGAAGIFRDKPYGVEIRTPSISIADHPTRVALLFSMYRTAFWIAAAGYADDFLALVPQTQVRDAINNSDRTLALANYNAIKKYLYAASHGEDLGKFGAMAALDFLIEEYDHADTRWPNLIGNWHLATPVSSQHGSLAPSWGRGWGHFVREKAGFDEFARNWTPDYEIRPYYY